MHPSFQFGQNLPIQWLYLENIFISYFRYLSQLILLSCNFVSLFTSTFNLYFSAIPCLKLLGSLIGPLCSLYSFLLLFLLFLLNHIFSLLPLTALLTFSLT